MNAPRKIAAGLSALALVGTLAACTGEQKSATEQAQQDRTKGVESLRAEQKVKTMKWSPTLNNVNRWAETWGQKGKVSYVYMQRQDGTFAGYYVLDGLPVNYCVSGAPTYNWEDIPGDGASTDAQVPAPASDGAYYGGCDASRYYGFSAVSGQYIEYTDGLVLTAVLSDQPLPLDKQPVAYADSIEDVEKAGKANK